MNEANQQIKIIARPVLVREGARHVFLFSFYSTFLVKKIALCGFRLIKIKEFWPYFCKKMSSYSKHFLSVKMRKKFTILILRFQTLHY
jgi:hypothetical protein